MRKLASIRKIDNIDPIPNKDIIGLAHIDGWTVIVNKNEFNIGDLCVYCEIDSMLPDKPEFEHVKKRTNLRIRTMKMAGVISQGICFPLSILPTGNYKLGDDVTDIMGVTQYIGNMDIEKDIINRKSSTISKFLMKIPFIRNLLSKKENDKYPVYIPKTDEQRVQNLPQVIEFANKNPNHTWYVHEKLDGQSGTFLCVRKKWLFWDRYEYIVCSRNIRLLQETNQSYWKVSKKYNIKGKLIEYLKTNSNAKYICVQGECIGINVQGNKYKIPDNDLYVFNVMTNNTSGQTVKFKEPEIDKFCTEYNFKRVPKITNFNFHKMTMDDVIKFADGKSALNKTTQREGIVVRDETISFKAISNKFLLKYD